MTKGAAATARGGRPARILGSYETGRPGPTFLVTAGLHGNEPAGAAAASRVAEDLLCDEPPLRGRYLALAGNLAALGRKARYLDEDLNRLWTPARIAALRARPPELDTAEQAEQRALLGLLDDCLRAARDGVVVLDLHTSSADGPPFVCMGDTIHNRRVAFALPVPVVLGLEETIDGAMLDYVYDRGGVAVAVEGGRHDGPATPANLEAAIWVGLVAAGCLDARDLPDLARHRRQLGEAAAGIPRVLEVRHREEVGIGDHFEMQPGYASFDLVQAGEVLACRNGEPVRAAADGWILLPLYQGQGSDGFFLARPVRPFWLRLSAWLRRLRCAALLPLFPGVRRHPSVPDAFVVDPRVASLWPVEVFHLLGYRRQRRDGDRLVFTRRREPR